MVPIQEQKEIYTKLIYNIRYDGYSDIMIVIEEDKGTRYFRLNKLYHLKMFLEEYKKTYYLKTDKYIIKDYLDICIECLRKNEKYFMWINNMNTEDKGDNIIFSLNEKMFDVILTHSEMLKLNKK